MTRPIALPVHVENIPAALKAERRWVVWRYVWKAKENASGRWSKILCSPDGAFAKSNDPTTWTTFADALTAYQAGGFDGIGFCLGDGWAGIDLDNVNSRVCAFIDQLPCYIETSPSGNGYKAVGRSARMGGEVTFDGAKLPAFTTWQGARFFTITGQGSGDPTVDISVLIDEWFPVTRPSPMPLANRPAYIQDGSRGTELINDVPQTDDAILLLAATATNREKFLKLFRGDMRDYGDDHSRADQALINILFYWCNGNKGQIDRLFRQSALMRDHWDTRSYRECTLRKAGCR
jgi:primase-polymerase (primpol)-like protein